MKVRDIMTKDVATVTPDTKVGEVARVMSERSISGLLVVSADGRLVGIVSETDLLHRAELGTEVKRSWWLEAFASSEGIARAFVKAHGLTAGDVMSTNVVAADVDTELVDVANKLERNKINRMPVLDGDALVGIVSRGDLVRALVHAPRAVPQSSMDLRQRVDARVKASPWLDTRMVSIFVDGDDVELRGFINSSDQRAALRVLIEEVCGSGHVRDHLRVGAPNFGGI